MDSASAALGALHSKSQRSLPTPEAHERRDDRCRYGRDVARMVSELCQDECDDLDVDAIRRRIRRWIFWAAQPSDDPGADRDR